MPEAGSVRRLLERLGRTVTGRVWRLGFAAAVEPVTKAMVRMQGTITTGANQFVQRAGYLEVAATNRVVLLFPQIEPSFQPLNPNGCWDWWGYEGEAYATQAGPQVRAVRGMIADLLGKPAAAAR